MLLVATKNSHKTEEIRAILADRFDKITDLRTQADHPEPDESGDTFEANARIKALAASTRFPDATILADDSGLDVDALDGAPGVHSSRYAGPDANDRDNREKLMQEMEGVDERSARFRCVMVLAKGGEVLATFDGTCEGHLSGQETGWGGFGYDRLFIPEGYYESFAILPSEIKNTLSHRAKALEQLKAWLT